MILFDPLSHKAAYGAEDAEVEAYRVAESIAAGTSFIKDTHNCPKNCLNDI